MPPAMRQLILILALLVTGSLLVACGKGTQTTAKTTAKSTTRTTTGAPTDTTRPLTKAQATSFIRAVNLRANDLPGFAVSHEREQEGHTTAEKRLEREMLRCVGGTGHGSSKGLAEGSSENFELKHGILDLGVSSEVGVAQTAAIAVGELAAIRSTHVRECFSHYLTALFKGKRFAGATVSSVSIKPGIPPAPGTTGGFAWRVTATISLHRLKLPFYMDLLGFVYGPARITLSSTGALKPFPAAIQQKLFSILLTRAKAHGV